MVLVPIKVACLELLFVERTVVIRNRGSVEFLPDEQGADIVLVDIKCTALSGTEYYNSKSIPPYGYYGCATLFGGATVEKRIPLEFVYQRALDFESIYRRLRCYLTKIEEIVGENFNALYAPSGVPPTASGEPRDTFEYRGLPYAKIKLTNDRAAQWDVTIRSYTEVDERCESVNKADDPTKGEDEFPSPLPIPDPNNFPSSLPQPTFPYDGADPRDFPPMGQPNEPRTVYFGLRLFATTGAQESPGICIQDATIPINHEVPNFGLPPYTIELGAETASVCTNGYFRGYYILDSEGGRSELLDSGAGMREVEIIVFSFEPFPPA